MASGFPNTFTTAAFIVLGIRFSDHFNRSMTSGLLKPVDRSHVLRWRYLDTAQLHTANTT
jgi:hypothetical protein